MRDIFLQAAGVLAVATALVHAYLGETLVFSRARIEPTRTALLLRLIWQAGAIGWLSLGLLLLAAPSLGSDLARRLIVFASALNFGFACLANAWVFRGKHFGWAALAAVVALSLAGL